MTETKKASEKHQKHRANEQQRSETLPLGGAEEKSESGAARQYQKYKKLFEGPWWFQETDPTARVTGWLAAYTFCLAMVSALQFCALHNTDDKIGRQLTLMEFDQRPWIGIHRVETSPIIVGEKLTIRAVFKNTGKTPALKWTASFGDPPDVKSSEDGLTDWPVCGPGQCGLGLLVPGAEFTIDVSIPKERVTEAFAEAIRSREQTIYIRGRTTYWDSAEQPHKTLVCMYYNPGALAFGYCQRENSNYAD